MQGRQERLKSHKESYLPHHYDKQMRTNLCFMPSSKEALILFKRNSGMARFCTERYAKPTSSNFENLYSHLTNYSLNKANASYVHSTNLRDQLRGTTTSNTKADNEECTIAGSKRLLSTVFHQMEAHGIRTRRLWHDIKMIVVKTVLAMVPEIMLNYEHCFGESAGPQCFQVLHEQ